MDKICIYFIQYKESDASTREKDIKTFHVLFLTFFQLKSLCLLFFIFSPNDSPSETVKMFIFLVKTSFRSWDIFFAFFVLQSYVFPSSPLFLLVSYCFRGRSKINLKVYDVINCLNKYLIKHFVWYPEKEKRYEIENLSKDRLLNKKHFYGKII